MLKPEEIVVRDSIIARFKERGLEYVDKTDKGGALFFFDLEASKELMAAGYEVMYAEKGARSTGGRPAWYIR